MKERLDVILVNRGFFPSREKAKAAVMAGEVFVDGSREDKAGTAFDAAKIQIEVKGDTCPYVSRGGYKLEKALRVFPMEVTDKICLDIGASTGGFTDCMLQNGAAKVYAVDSGRGQLAWKLRQDERVVCMEKTNFRYMQPQDIPDAPQFASADVSFISLTRILLPARNLLVPAGEMVCLVKPQFEAGRDKVGKKGVVRDKDVHAEVVQRIVSFASLIGFRIAGLSFSPIKGPEGNIEYLLFLQKEEELTKEQLAFTEAEALGKLKEQTQEKTGLGYDKEMRAQIQGVVEEAHLELD